MALTAREAADQVGMSRQGVIKAIRTGKLSATKSANGEWQIEPVELFRVYAPVDGGTPDGVREDTPSLQVEIRLLRELLAAKDDQIRDLQKTLDTERQRLTLLLPGPKPAPWWRRLGR